MGTNFSLFNELSENIQTIENIDDCMKITLGPTGKNGMVLNEKNELKILTNGSKIIKTLEFPTSSGNILLKLLEQASLKTFTVSGDGSTTTIILSCQLLKTSLRFLSNGYNPVFLSNGLKKIAYFLVEKVLELSVPVSTKTQLDGVLKTSLGKKLHIEMLNLLSKSLDAIDRDGLILVEENISSENELESVQGIELDRGFASSYFVNDVKNFEVVYENPYILLTSQPLTNINQIREIINFIKTTNRSLIIVAEDINKEIISTLVLNNIQKKFKVAVINYKSVKFIKNGILEDLALLTHAHYFSSEFKNTVDELTINDLGQAEKVIIKKGKSTFLISKFSKVIAKRRINELNRELLTSETEYEKSIFKTRIARLSGNITKIKIGFSNQYEIEEQRQKIESAINTIKSALEEGILPGGGIFYLKLREELKNWSYLNLVGDEIFATQISLEALMRPFQELLSNNNISSYTIFEKLSQLGYPNSYDLLTKNIGNSFEKGILDSSKSIRASLWNSLTIVSTIITSE
jgi:chaperonin GroEL